MGTHGVGRLPPRTSGLLFGLGLGGFVDGIVLHQILQWHHMVSAETAPTTLAGLETNTLADGFFHLATWVCVLAASITSITAWRQGRLAPSYSFHFGLVLAGWGIFNLVEGVIDHQLLGVHHVRDDLGGPLSWDLGFLASGVLLVGGGLLLHRRGVRQVRPRATRAARSTGP
ncbi:DUF2243 domain-containing protein [Blastococcus sp. CT_GayMR20]|uniref:DUF2243 domain-containing protein n=1 Tax=Blastococcus sp. CT_GayMR20 TaxID=2559609 RepID=UPI001073B4EC|nr:DUF2243 domain-containing protein [Blastococcus sp. CT_GayMR20]TFV81363.1 DUF2243 domain-containing protein [Blastococcus sp. CT_GayMR20]TFV81372.1 DUF2243 domain-containing protein [Blastococcus sp. CT_GayMR20]